MKDAETARAMLAEMKTAERKAWDSLSRYKFVMFGYWAAIWVHLNRMSGAHRKNPFAPVVKFAKGFAKDT